MSEEYNEYSEALWAEANTPEKWRKFMFHDWMNPSRFLAFYIIADHTWANEDKVSLAEIGFGDLFDFRVFFKLMDDKGKIKYTGYEIMPHFVRYASDEYWDYEFRRGGFMDLEPESYDIIYTRHTLEHIHPMLWRKCLARMLKATRQMCVLTWYMPPTNTRLMAKNWTGKGWHNRYYRVDVFKVIEGLGFQVAVWDVNSGDEIWCITRRE